MQILGYIIGGLCLAKFIHLQFKREENLSLIGPVMAMATGAVLLIIVIYRVAKDIQFQWWAYPLIAIAVIVIAAVITDIGDRYKPLFILAILLSFVIVGKGCEPLIKALASLERGFDPNELVYFQRQVGRGRWEAVFNTRGARPHLMQMSQPYNYRNPISSQYLITVISRQYFVLLCGVDNENMPSGGLLDGVYAKAVNHPKGYYVAVIGDPRRNDQRRIPTCFGRMYIKGDPAVNSYTGIPYEDGYIQRAYVEIIKLP